MEKILAANKELFAGDLWLMCDGSVHQTRVQQIQFGARGVAGLDMTVYGPRVELHGGVYGNWAPNPAMMLVRLLATMKDEVDRVQGYLGARKLSELGRDLLLFDRQRPGANATMI